MPLPASVVTLPAPLAVAPLQGGTTVVNVGVSGSVRFQAAPGGGASASGSGCVGVERGPGGGGGGSSVVSAAEPLTGCRYLPPADERFVIFSDRSKSIIAAVANVLPDAYHVHCSAHLKVSLTFLLPVALSTASVSSFHVSP